jgi:Matrixin
MSKVGAKLRVEPLEGREIPAAFGIPWGNAGHLTLSFAPDGTSVAGQASTLGTEFAGLPSWKEDILRAFQTWAVKANVTIAVTPDGGQAFGTPGPTQGDARFGDIRIAAAPMSGESLSVSAPHDPFLSGSWAGDVVFNTDKVFGPGGSDLFAVALHEAGHVLGLDHNPSGSSVMYSHLGPGRTTPSEVDIANLRALYGTRAADPFEKLTGNNSLRTATRMDRLPDADFDGDVPLAVFGDLRATADVDHFAVVIPDRYFGPVTFRLQTAGVSLLKPSLTVLDGSGRMIQADSSTELGGDTLRITIPNAMAGQKYHVGVDGATSDVFGVGAYALAVTLDGELDPQVTEQRIDAVLRGPYRSLGQNDLQYLFEDPAYLLNADEGTNETPGSATRLVLPGGYTTRTHYEYTGSLEFGGDVDTYAIRTPAWARPGALTATVWGVGPAAAMPTIRVTDKFGNPVAADILANGNGTYTIQVTRAAASRDYFVQVTGSAAGNYSLAVDLTRQQAPVESFASDAMTAAQPNTGRALYVAQSQVFDFILTAQGVAGSVRMTVFERNGSQLKSLFTLTAAAGQTVTGPGLFLRGGKYAVVFESLAGAAGYVLRGAGLTVPIGPITTDPSGKPIFTLPDAPPGQYVYPGDLIGSDAELAALIGGTYQIPVQPPAPSPAHVMKVAFLMAPLFLGPAG